MEEEKKENDAKIEKLRQEMETVFAMKVKEKVRFSSSSANNIKIRLFSLSLTKLSV